MPDAHGPNTSLGIAVLSFAFGHANQNCRAIATLDDAEVRVVWDDDHDRGRAAAANHQLQFDDDITAVLGRVDVDAVIIACETDRHADLVERAAAAGKHILLQKPMAYTLEDCDRIARAVERAGVKFSMAFQMRHDPVNLEMKRLVDAGELGEIGLVKRRHSGSWLLTGWDGLSQPSRFWEFDGSRTPGTFMYEGIHACDFFRWLMGPPVSVTAQIDDVIADRGIDDFGVAIYRFESGAIGVQTSSGAILAAESTTEIYGSEGVLIQNYGDSSSSTVLPRDDHAQALKLYRRGSDPPAWKTFDFSPHVVQPDRILAVAEPFIDYLHDRGPQPASLADGRGAVEMAVAAYESARSGRTVELPLG